MNYSEFIYTCAKEGANTYGDATMDYAAFLLGGMGVSEVYADCLDRTYVLANQFFQRCSSLGKLRCKVVSFEECDGSGLVMGEDCSKPLAVFQYDDDERQTDYRNLEFRTVGKKVKVIGRVSPYRKVNVQYRPKVPMFGKKDIRFIEEANAFSYMVTGIATAFMTFDGAYAAAEEKQVDLEDYGFSDELLMIGVDWIKGRLNDDTSMGHSQEIEAESRLNDFDPDEFLFLQRRAVM